MTGKAWRALRELFPFTHEGRQTLVYLAYAGCGPALTLAVIWAMQTAAEHGQWSLFGQMALVVSFSLLIIVTGHAMFVSIRALKLNKDGFEAQGGPADGDSR